MPVHVVAVSESFSATVENTDEGSTKASVARSKTTGTANSILTSSIKRQKKSLLKRSIGQLKSLLGFSQSSREDLSMIHGGKSMASTLFTLEHGKEMKLMNKVSFYDMDSLDGYQDSFQMFCYDFMNPSSDFDQIASVCYADELLYSC